MQSLGRAVLREDASKGDYDRLAASLVVALIWSRWPQPTEPDAELLESMDLLVAEESIEFYQDLEFLEWAELEEELLLDELDSEESETTGGLDG